MDVGILLVLSLVIDEVISGRGREVISKREKRMQSSGVYISFEQPQGTSSFRLRGS
jgi:hypothetical protein